MDASGWDPLRSNPNIPAKRAWDGDASHSSVGPRPRSGEAQPPGHYLHYSGPKHTPRSTSDTPNIHTGWDTGPQTQSWPVKPDPGRHGAGLDDSYGTERWQHVDSRDAPQSRPDPNAGPYQPQPAWPSYRRESSGSSYQTAFDPPSSSNGKLQYYIPWLSMLISSTEMIYPGSQETRTSSYTADELGPQDPPRSVSTKASIIEQNCERCNLFRPRIKEFISMIQKLETSLGPFGPYQEIHELVRSFWYQGASGTSLMCYSASDKGRRMTRFQTFLKYIGPSISSMK